MTRVLLAVFKRLGFALSAPVILAEYFDSETGKEYGIGFWKKLRLAIRMKRNHGRITTGSYVIEHLIMATEIMKVPKALEGCVVECGTFKGGSATNLSLVCELCNRSIEIFDSFQGLPEPSEADREHVLVGAGQIHTYNAGAWKGTLDEVKKNITDHGKIGLCRFNVGYFSETMPTFQKKVVFAFLDVDLRGSLEPCIKTLWPLLQDGSYIFTHEAPHTEISSFFFSDDWWTLNVGCKPPGLTGAGNGLGLLPAPGGYRSDLGYTVKNPQAATFHVNPQTGVIGS